jgi:hypothetical protein
LPLFRERGTDGERQITRAGSGWYGKLSIIMLAILLFIFIVTIHIPHLLTEADRTVALIALITRM